MKGRDIMKKLISAISFVLVLVMLTSGATVFGEREYFKDFGNNGPWSGWDGYPDGTFHPDEKITRAEFLCYLYKFHNHLHEEVRVDVKPIREYKNNFTDISPKKWYYKYVVWAYERGIINGVGNGRFDPNSTINALDYSLMMKRLYSAAFTEEWYWEVDAEGCVAMEYAIGYGKDNYNYESTPLAKLKKNAVLIKLPKWYTKEVSIDDLFILDIWVGGEGDYLDMTKFSPARGDLYKHSHTYFLWFFSS